MYAVQLSNLHLPFEFPDFQLHLKCNPFLADFLPFREKFPVVAWRIRLPTRTKQKLCITYESANDKTYNKTCATSEDSDQPAHPRSLI